MKVLFPSRSLAPYIETYYISSDLRQDSPPAHFPAISTSYIKFSRTSAVVSGQATRPTAANASFSSGTGLGVKLRPGAFPSLFGIPAHEVTDRVIPLEDILGNSASGLIEQISTATTASAQLQLFEKALMRFVQSRYNSKDLIGQEVVTVLRKLSIMQVSKLAQTLGYSSRHFQRKLNEFIGFSPRLYRRISRFERTLELIQISSKHGKTNWSAIALACNYTDQSHFIREFRQFAGQTPAAYLAALQGSY